MGVITPEQLAQQYGFSLSGDPAKPIKPVKAAAGDLASPGAPSFLPMSYREAQSFSSRGIPVAPKTHDQAVDYRAEDQSFGEDLANTIARGTIGALGVALEDLTYMPLQPLGEALGVLDSYEKNIFAAWGEELKNSGRELFPNYKKHDAGMWNGWDIVSDLIENGVGFAIPGLVAGKIGMSLGKLGMRGLSALGKTERFAKVAAYANALREAGHLDKVISTVGGGFLSNYAEGTMMGMETYQDLMSRVGELNKDGEVITEEMAVQAANNVRNMNRALMMTDMFQIHGLYKGTKAIRNTVYDPRAWKENLKAAFTTINAENPFYQSLVEGFEEIAQGVLQREAANNVTRDLKDSDFVERIGKYLSEESLWYEGALGFLSGGVQSQVMKFGSDMLDVRKANKLQAQIDNLSAQMNQETDPAKKEDLQLVIQDLEDQRSRATRVGQYESQQQQLLNNEEYLGKSLDSLAKQQSLMELALREGNERAADYIAKAGFSKLFFDNASRGTVDSLERSLQDLIDQDLSNEEREARGLAANYKDQARQHLTKIKELEKDYLKASAYINPAAIYFEIQNLKIQNEFLGGTRNIMNEISDGLKKDLASQKVTGVSVEDVLNDRVTKTDDPEKNAKIDSFVSAVKKTPAYKEYQNLRESEGKALEYIEDTEDRLKTLKSKAYEKEIRDKIKANEQAEQDSKKKAVQAEAQSKKQSEKIKRVNEAKGVQPSPEEEVEETSPVVPPKDDGGGSGAVAEKEAIPEEKLPNVPDLFSQVNEEQKKEEDKTTSEEGADVQAEDDDFTPNLEDVEEGESEVTPSLEDLQPLEGEITDTPLIWDNSVENTETSNGILENLNAEEDLSALPTPEANAGLREKLDKEYNNKVAEANKLESSDAGIKVTTGNTRGGSYKGGKETSDELNPNTDPEQLRNILDPDVAKPGTGVYFEIDYDSPYFNPPGNTIKGLSYGAAQEKGSDFGPYAFFGVPIKVFTADGKFIGYLPAITVNNNVGIAEGGFNQLAGSALGLLRAKIVANPDTRFTSKVKSRLNGHYFKTKESAKDEKLASDAVKDSDTLIVKGLNDKLFATNGKVPENLDKIAQEVFVERGHTYIVLPDGGVVPLFKQKLNNSHKKMLASAVTLFAKAQSKANLTEEDKKNIAAFKKAGYNVSTLAGIESLLNKYVYLHKVDKAFNLIAEDHALETLKPTSSLAKWMKSKSITDKAVMAKEGNGIAFVNPFSPNAGSIGISIGPNTPAGFVESQKFASELEKFLNEQFYNTDVAALSDNESFTDVFFDENSGQIESMKVPYSKHLMSHGTTNIVGHNIGTEDKPKYSYRVNPTIMIETEVAATESKPEIVEEKSVAPEISEETKAPKTKGEKVKTVDDLPPHLRAIFGKDVNDDALPSEALSSVKAGEFKSYLMFKGIMNQKGYVTNYAEFQNAAAEWTTRLSKRISETLGVPVRLMQLATLDVNNRVIMNQRSLDFFDLATRGVTNKTAYLVKEMEWLRDNQFVQKMTAQRLTELKQHKITCR